MKYIPYKIYYREIIKEVYQALCSDIPFNLIIAGIREKFIKKKLHFPYQNTDLEIIFAVKLL